MRRHANSSLRIALPGSAAASRLEQRLDAECGIERNKQRLDVAHRVVAMD